MASFSPLSVWAWKHCQNSLRVRLLPYDSMPGQLKNSLSVSLYLSVWKTGGDKWMDVNAVFVSLNPLLTFCLTMNNLWSFATTKEWAFPLMIFIWPHVPRWPYLSQQTLLFYSFQTCQVFCVLEVKVRWHTFSRWWRSCWQIPRC